MPRNRIQYLIRYSIQCKPHFYRMPVLYTMPVTNICIQLISWCVFFFYKNLFFAADNYLQTLICNYGNDFDTEESLYFPLPMSQTFRFGNETREGECQLKVYKYVSSKSGRIPYFIFNGILIILKFHAALENCVWPGRFQTVEKGNITYYLDGAHTHQSMKYCARWFAELSSQHSSKYQ